MVNLEMLITAEESKEFGVEFEFEIDESTKLAISDEIKKVFDASELPPYEFKVSELIEHWKDTPPMGFEMCAQGAARLALGLSKINASYPGGNSIPEKALEELSFHSSRNANIKDPRWENGFLGSLRPFQSMELVEQNFNKVIRNLKDLLKHTSENDCLCKNLVNDVSGIICFGRAWAVEEDGMLRRNNLITKEQAKLIEDWIDCISYAWTMMLDTGNEETAFALYDEKYKNDYNI